MKLLCTADIHLGRHPSRIPDEMPADALTPAAAWNLTVNHAIAEEVDAVLIAGDVVERNDDFYGAYPDLLHGVNRLTKAGIEVLAVAGNHDQHVLPLLTRAVPEVRLLGAKGTWEVYELRGKDGTTLDVVGWSFPHDVVSSSPLSSFPKLEGERTRIGLLHGDRDASGGHYAPFSSAELRALPVHAWLLGHIHKPDFNDDGGHSGYLGSLVGTDPGEPGPHGPWILDVSPTGTIEATHVPLAPLRWLDLGVDASEVEDPRSIVQAITTAIARRHEELQGEVHRPSAVGLRIHVTGRHARVEEIRTTLAKDDPTGTPIPHGEITYFVHRLHLAVAPERDLEELAQTHLPADQRALDPVGLLAHKILVLRGPDNEAKHELVSAALARFEQEKAKRPFTGVEVDLPDETKTVQLLEWAALHALEQLLAQDAVHA